MIAASQTSRQVCLFQPGVSHGRGAFEGYYLPYSVGCLWSYVSANPKIAGAYALAELVFRRERHADVVARLDRPDVAGFSGYIWNWRWNLRMAQLIKQRWPGCLIVFGGPQVPEQANHNLFLDHPFIDIAVHAEGEATFLEILERRLEGRSLAGIPGTSLPGPGGTTISHPRRLRLDPEAEDVPSPFLDGTFDALVARHPEVHWHATLETHRGCPFKCTFCDWGSLIHTKIKKFGLDKVSREIEWLGRQSVDYVFIADANFGAFLDRDERVVAKLVETRAKTGAPKAVAATWFKNSNEQTLRLAQRLDAAGLSRGITLSVQSMNPATLKAIKRDNMKFSQLELLFGMAEAAGLPVVTEMILGLPEETYDSWVEGICKVLDLGNHSAVTFYPAELLVNAELSTEATRRQYGIRSARLYGWAWDPDNLEEGALDEVSEVVIATGTLPHEDYLDALMFSWLILNFHVEGWTQLLARFVRRHSSLGYRRFYDGLQRWIEGHPESLLGREYLQMRQSWSEYFASGRQGAHAYRIGKLQIQGYMQIHGTQYVLRARAAQAWSEIADFFGTLDHGLDGELAADLLGFQDAYVTRFGRPFDFAYDARHNIWEYLRGEEELSRYPRVYGFAVTEPYDRNDIDDFLNKTYFRRRAGFGKMRVGRRLDVVDASPAQAAALT